VAGCQSKVGL